MKFEIKITFLFIILALMVFDACEAIDKLTHFKMDYDETISIPSTIGINLPFNLFTPNITTNSQEVFEINDTRKDMIEMIQLTEMEFEIITPEGEDFSFLTSIEVYINAEDLEEVNIAWNTNIGEDPGGTIQLETSNDDLKEYIKKDSFNLRVKTVTDEIILTDHEINVHSTFFVDAKILGI